MTEKCCVCKKKLTNAAHPPEHPVTLVNHGVGTIMLWGGFFFSAWTEFEHTARAAMDLLRMKYNHQLDWPS